MEPVVIDNFLSSRYFSRIKEVIESEDFNWYFKKCITFADNSTESLYSYGFDNAVITDKQVNNQNMFNLLTGFYSQLLDIAKCSILTKSRIDMVTYSPDKHQHSIHVDEYFPHVASIFYLTDSDAETILYDQKCYSHDQYKTMDLSTLNTIKIVESKENRLLFFDGTYLHTGCSPSQYKRRIIINTDLVK